MFLLNGNIKEKTISALKKHWLFFVAFIIMAVYLYLSGSMTNICGDAMSIWETIKSFYSGKIVSSYVLYKGMGSVYPYVWLYQLSLLLGVGEFFFIKIFHCLLFSYISVIGLPYLIENLLGIKAFVWRKALLMLFLFVIWQYTFALSQLVVDLPSFAYFLFLVNSALKIPGLQGKRLLGRCIYTGLLLGLNTCMSGQYSVAAVAILVYIFIKMFNKQVFKQKKKILITLACVFVMLLSLLSVRAGNTYFEKTITDPLRDSGEWIPSGDVWLSVALPRMHNTRSLSGQNIPDNRGTSIQEDYYGSDYDDVKKSIDAGGAFWSISNYLSIFVRYPMDFLTRYGNRLFLILSPDRGSLHFSLLFFAYTFLFSVFLSIKNRCKRVRHFFSSKSLIVLSFILAIAPLLVMTVEMRCVMQLQGLVYGVAILDDSIWKGLRSFGLTVKECWKQKTLRFLGDKPLPFTFLVYLAFMILCFVHIASLYEAAGASPDILFRI